KSVRVRGRQNRPMDYPTLASSGASGMRVYELLAGSTSLESLRMAERPDPTPGPRDVVIRVRAASLNYRDQAVVTGNYFGGGMCAYGCAPVRSTIATRRWSPGTISAGC